MLGSKKGPQWLTSKEDVVAHLYFAAAEIGTVSVEMGVVRVGGSISFPSPDLEIFSFFASSADDEPAPPEPGTVVRVHYSRGDSVYSFLTEVAESNDQGRWRLSFPRTIERTERRIVGRHRVLAVGGFRIRMDRGDGVMVSLPLVDLSTAGLSFVYESEALSLSEGRAVAGSVLLPSGTAIPLLMEIRNLRSAPDRRGQQVAGCRFLGLAAQDHAVLARALADQSHHT